MPKETNIEHIIPKLYKKSALNQLLFGYVKGCRSALHTLTIKEAILMFMADFALTHDSYNCDSAAVTYDRMQKDLIELKKT